MKEQMINNPLINKTLLQMKYARIIMLLAERMKVSAAEALGVFYRTRVYDDMSHLRSQLHNMSDAYVADEVMLELLNQ